MRTNIIHIVFSVFFLTIGLTTSYGQELGQNPFKAEAIQESDTLRIVPELPIMETDSVKTDTVETFKKALIDGKIKYKAEDYSKIDQKNKSITLYNQAELYYTDIELKAGVIVMNYEKNEV
ncbi:MAG TPA: hypothetical protein VLZ72_09350, partial [Flavobacterium sp.]|nr:hypothetical protein [Flavobacterium sp.]